MLATLPVFAALLARASGSPKSRTTHSNIILDNGAEFEAYHPPNTFEVFETGIDTPLSTRATKPHFKDNALSFLHSRLGSNAVQYRSGYEGDVAAHVYVHQQFNGIRVANAVANVAQNKAGKVTSFGSSFVQSPRNVASPTPKISSSQAVNKATAALGGALIPGRDVQLEYLATDDGDVVLVHVVPIEFTDGKNVLAYVNAASGVVVSVITQTFDATFRAIPPTLNNPNDGFALIENPEDPLASPNGWTTINGVDTHATNGTNIRAIVYTTKATIPESSDDVWDSTWDPTVQPTVAANTRAAGINSFHLANVIHDITYRYGFTEEAFNFQGNDPIIVNVQSTIGTNNAFFSTAPDGTSGQIHMLLWTLTTPRRDGDVENDVLAHEWTHGLSTRLTGGGVSTCLNTLESQGLGEGWSDSFADWLAQTSEDLKDFELGAYVFTKGIRTKPYSVDPTINNYTYSLFQQSSTDPHFFGELWAEVLHLQLDALIKEHGFADDAHTNPDSTAGNVVWLHLFIDALALQPCNPTFLQARLAWIQADANRYNGANKCLLWGIFAGRGIGVNADSSHVDNFDLPADC
ncbi:metalloprotease [Exidia glandulosa HHB12029]|uniref:Extracellular metalloproteinase n=1 Tax=Exidia glandulosa HHB12029 TaxID=1314781 RepID=A0A165G0G8_EXIGL|nr:metalloprotease [Exidia glandulosa HHB12029]